MPDFLYKIPLKELVAVQRGTKPAVLVKQYFEGAVPYLDISVLESRKPKEYTYKQLANNASDNDVLVVWDGSRSGLPLKGMAGAIGSTLLSLTPIELERDYLYFFIKSKFDFINGNSTGTGIPHVDPDIFFNLQVPYISIERQKAFVADVASKINQNNIFLDSRKKAIHKTLADGGFQVFDEQEINIAILKFRETILQRAFNGEITKQWRDKNKVPKTTWVKRSLSSLTSLITSGSRDWSQFYSKTGARFIRTQDIKNNRINKDNMIFVDLPDHVEGKRTLVERGNLLLTIVGSNIGKCAIVDDNFAEEGYVNQAIALIKLTDEIDPYFLYLYFQSPEAQNKIKDKIYGDAQPDLNLKDIRNFELFVPSFSEQLEISKEVKVLFELAERIQKYYEETLEKTSKLEKAILEEAFVANEKISTSKTKSLEMILRNIKAKKEVLENERRESNKTTAKLKNAMINEIRKKKPILEILKETPKLTVEELWKESVYFQDKDVERFYLELTELKTNKKISTAFGDESKTYTNINLL